MVTVAYGDGNKTKYGLISNLTLDLTDNTDFAQIESDRPEVGVNNGQLVRRVGRLLHEPVGASNTPISKRLFRFQTFCGRGPGSSTASSINSRRHLIPLRR